MAAKMFLDMDDAALLQLSRKAACLVVSSVDDDSTAKAMCDAFDQAREFVGAHEEDIQIQAPYRSPPDPPPPLNPPPPPPQNSSAFSLAGLKRVFTRCVQSQDDDRPLSLPGGTRSVCLLVACNHPRVVTVTPLFRFCILQANAHRNQSCATELGSCASSPRRGCKRC